MLADIANTESASTPLGQILRLPAPANCRRTALNEWTAKLAEDPNGTDPVLESAIRWLRRNPPSPPASIRIVRGNIRTGNFLCDDQGRIRAAGLGNVPSGRSTGGFCPGIWLDVAGWPRRATGRLIALDKALEIYRSATGNPVNRRDLLWWRVAGRGQGAWPSG